MISRYSSIVLSIRKEGKTMSKFKSIGEYFAYSKTLSVIPTEDVIQLLKNFQIKVPFYAHRFILRETIYPKVFQNKLYQTYSDELKYRLRGYNDYSIYLLEKLIKDYNIDFDAAKYKENFFNFLFLNKDIYGLKNNFYDELDKLKFKYTVDFEKIKYQNFIDMFTTILYEPSGYLDGVSLKILKDVLVHSCTLGDLRGLGEKYGVKIPRRINKTKLVEILAARFRSTAEETLLLNEKSVLELEIYAKEKGFNISIDLKKSDMVEYLIFDLKMYYQEVQKDNHSYQIPLISDLDSVKIDTIQFETNDQDIPVNEIEPEIKINDVLSLEEEQEILTEQLSFSEEVIPASDIEDKKSPLPMDDSESNIENTNAPEPRVVENTIIQPATPEPMKIPPIIEPTSVPIVSKEIITVSDEEKELLDEKINIIIRKYKKHRRNRRIWLTILFITSFLILGFIGYSYLYYTVINPNTLPFGIPVFW